jgi:ACT domain-containing protein
MKIDMVLRVRDVPGMLINALGPISGHGGNIISVTHSRAEKDLVSVHVSFKVNDESSLELIKKALEAENIRVAEIKVEGRKYYLKKSLSFVLIGHVIDSDMQDTIDRINKVGLVSGLEVVMPSPDEKSSVLMEAEIDEKHYTKLIKVVSDICSEKDFLLIRSL